jgi:beta-phosphoglucomutase-like phosphatase (HAD superfamily)
MTAMPSWQAVFWDMDGTLIDSEKLWSVALRDLTAHLGGELRPDVRAAMVGTNMAVTLRLMFESLGLPLERAAVLAAGQWLRSRAAELFRVDLTWCAGAQEALTAFGATGVPMALVTSTERALTEIVLDEIGRDHFTVTICGDEVDGRNKPDPAPYLWAARLLGVDPRECLAVEDSPTGTASADAAGCQVVVVPSEVEVPPGPRRRFRATLVGFGPDTAPERPR